jgi:toxin ParE1/3/4
LPRLNWTPLAEGDLESIEAYIAQDNPVAAARLVLAILRKVEILAQHARLGRVGRVAGTRELVLTGSPYVVVYQEAGPDVNILAVLHSARQWPEKFEP